MCFIAEPVLGSGGVIVPPLDYNRRCWETVKKYGIVYIADEVVTAFGRLGHWFASQEVFGVVPDIIVFAKGVTSGYVPMGGFAVSESLYARDLRRAGAWQYFLPTVIPGRRTRFPVPPHWPAGTSSSARDLLQHVLEVGPYFQQQLRTLLDIPLVGDVRGTGIDGGDRNAPGERCGG